LDAEEADYRQFARVGANYGMHTKWVLAISLSSTEIPNCKLYGERWSGEGGNQSTSSLLSIDMDS
jgi:hypothetical protein